MTKRAKMCTHEWSEEETYCNQMSDPKGNASNPLCMDTLGTDCPYGRVKQDCHAAFKAVKCEKCGEFKIMGEE